MIHAYEPAEVAATRRKPFWRRLWFFPIAALGLGVVFFIGATGWAVASGVAVPDQDPTPQMEAYARFHERIVNAMLFFGILAFIAGVLSIPVLLIHRFINAAREE